MNTKKWLLTNTVMSRFLKSPTRGRLNRREDKKNESPHCDTDTAVSWTAFQQHYARLQLRLMGRRWKRARNAKEV